MSAIRFPWPDQRLSPNNRSRHLYLTSVRQHAREVGYWLAKDAGWNFPKNRTLELFILICPPDNRGRDDDNVYSMFKSYRDGIFQALGVNDKKIKRTILEWGEVEQNGALYVELKVKE